MATITVSDQDVQAADTFLTAYLQEKVPDADFSQGSIMRDFVVQAIAYVFAYLESERAAISRGQSLLALSQQPPGDDVDAAIVAHLSNWFLTPRAGEASRVALTLHFTQRVDVRVPSGTRFYKTQSLVYLPEASSAITIPASDLLPVVGPSGVITEYVTTISVKAAGSGAAYNVTAGKFVGADFFSPYFSYAENLLAATGGTDTETAQQLLARAPTAISVRNLVNARSIDVVLKQEFPSISQLVTVGFGDPEMLRDFASELVSLVRFHTGGYADIFVSLPRTTSSPAPLLVGGYQARPDGLAVEFEDVNADFSSGPTAVEPGDILKITDGLPPSILSDPASATAREYVITQVVTPTRLVVQAAYPFPIALDEEFPVQYATYSIGNESPDFNQKVTLGTTGQTSRKIKRTNCVILPGGVHYKFNRITVQTSGGPVELSTRVNTAPTEGQYRVEELMLGTAQSSKSVTAIRVNGAYAGNYLTPVYESLSGLDAVQAYVDDPFQRLSCANVLIRGYHPVYVGGTITCQLKRGATAVLDETAVAAAFVDYVNAFDPNQVLDVSGVIQALRDKFTDIGVMLGPLKLRYTLLAPTGEVYVYETSDVVTVFPEYGVTSATLVNGLEFTPGSKIENATSITEVARRAANQQLRYRLEAMGVSDRVVRYMADPGDVSVVAV